jgi:hypothetical protein
MARLPVLRKRQLSKREQVLDDMAKRYAKAVVAVKHAPAGAKLAAGGAKTYATTRWSTAPKRSRARFFVIPVVVASGVVVMRKVRKNGNSSEAETERPLGPVASADTVSPPADAAAAAAQSEAAATQSEATAN